MKRFTQLAVYATMVAAAAVFIVGAASGAAGHTHAAKVVKTVPANFISPVHLASTFEGCNNDGTITLPDGSGKFVCPDGDYTSGNLGKGWNELDLVPFRLILTAGTQAAATTDYNLIVGGDSKLSGVTGWDAIGDPSINPSIGSGNKTITSDASCQVSANAQDIGPGITGGADSSLYRVLTVHQNKGTTCVIDYYMRIALGAAGYPGSSLQAYIFQTSDFSTGKSTIPLPVNQIQPQSVSKDMAATRDSNTPWNLTKGATPNTVAFGNVCDAGFSNTANVAVTVTWTKLAAVPSGQVLLVANVYATNPSARTITTTVSDQMYEGSGTSTPLGSPFTATKDVPANTADYPMGTFQQAVTSSATQFNDVVTATYTDLVTGVPILGTTTASALATVQTGTTTNSTATVTDSESITGSSLQFAVTSRSGSPSGSYTNGYTQGTYVPGGGFTEVDWSSGTNAISDTGSITFNKTIKLGSLVATTGTLSDSASLNASDGGSAGPATASIDISSTKTVSLTINKSISQALASDQAFSFTVTPPSGPTFPATVTIPAGQTSAATTIPGLAPGTYGVAETVPAGWTNATSSKSVNATGCTNSVSFTNNLAPATAFANKITSPTGFESGWTFTLTRPDNTTLTGTTDSNGHVVWTGGTSTSANLAADGTYTISETLKNGWTEVGAAQSVGSTGTVTGGTGAGAQCSFTISYPTDAGKTFGCDITNQGIGHIIVKKVTQPSGSSQSFSYTTTGTGYSGFSLQDQGTNDQTVNAGDYSVTEGATTGWNLSGVVCANTSLTPGNTFTAGATSNVHIAPGGTVTCTYTNQQQATIIVKKVTQPAGSSQSFSFTTTGSGYNGFSLTGQSGGDTNSQSVVPNATYTVSEGATTGWNLSGSSCDNGMTPSAITPAPGQTITCTFTNVQNGKLLVRKVTDPSPDPSSSSFSFTGGGAGVDPTFSLANGGSKEFDNLLPGSGFSVSEGSLTGTGWTLQSATCDNGNNPSAITVNPGQTVTCTFTNISRGHVRLIKTLNGGALGSQSFTFQLRSGASTTSNGTTLESQDATAGNGGTINFATALVPGQTYQICELLVAGYGPNFPSGFGPYNPNDDPNYLCFNFSITVAQAADNPSVTFTVDNSHSFTKALTIGYWKNWNSCSKSNGKQTDQLGPLLPITIGPLTISSCQDAVNLLSKQNLQGKKMPGDPIYNMVAQLVAAEVNVKDGAGSCTAANSAISDANALLNAINFDGKASYTKTLTQAQQDQANSLNTTLDAYNNNNLC